MSSSISTDTQCRYGSGCYRKNPIHFKEYAHDHLEELLPIYRGDPVNFTIPPAYLASHGITDAERIKIQLGILKDLCTNSGDEDSDDDGDSASSSAAASTASSAPSSQKMIRLQREMSAEPTGNRVTRTPLPSGTAEYYRVEDQVMKSVRPEHNWRPTVTRIEKVVNLRLQHDYEAALAEALGDYEDYKFHGTSQDVVVAITTNGFKLGGKGMFGGGVYFSTDSSKSAQQMYTRGCNTLLLCHVIIGKCKELRQPDYTVTMATLRAEGFDSVFAPRNSKGSGGVLFDEFVIYDVRQAYPEYVITYSTN